MPAIRSFPSGAAELLKTFNGVEYKIRISAFTLQEKGKIAKARYEMLRNDIAWGANALKPGTDEAKELADIQADMVRGGVR